MMEEKQEGEATVPAEEQVAEPETMVEVPYENVGDNAAEPEPASVEPEPTSAEPEPKSNEPEVASSEPEPATTEPEDVPTEAPEENGNEDQEDEDEEDNVSETQPLTGTEKDSDTEPLSSDRKGDTTDSNTEAVTEDTDSKSTVIENRSAGNDIELEKMEETADDTAVNKDKHEDNGGLVPVPTASTANIDVEAAQPNGKTLDDSKSVQGKQMLILELLRKKEIVLCFIGGLAFLLGLIMIIVGLMIMQGKCDRHYWKPEQSGNGHEPESRPLFKSSVPGVESAQEHHHRHHHHEVTYNIGDHNKTHDGHKNLALNKDAYMSSIALSKDSNLELNASLATDGIHNNKIKNDACAQTGIQSHPYWYVDLGETHPVKRVKILIPGDCCMGELHDFEVRIGQSEDITQNKLCQPYLGTALKVTFQIECDETIFGRFVSIQMLGDDLRLKDRLILCEVMVYAK